MMAVSSWSGVAMAVRALGQQNKKFGCIALPHCKGQEGEREAGGVWPREESINIISYHGYYSLTAKLKKGLYRSRKYIIMKALSTINNL